MSCLQPSRQRCIPVRVVDVPREVRMKAARSVANVETDPLEKLRVMLLAWNPPSTLVAWIRP